MSTLYLLLAVGCVVWILVVFHSWLTRPKWHPQQVMVNPKVNLGRVAGVHSIQGARSHMEDAYYGDHVRGFFGVYDGHGGSRCSSYTSAHLHELVYKHNVGNGTPDAANSAAVSSSSASASAALAIVEGFKELDRHWLELAALNGWDDGTTAITCLIQNKTLYVANVGDSRAVLSCRGGAIEMSSDHKPNKPEEKERIEKLGGRIIHYGTWRVEGVLAVTRAIGDRRLKRYVSSVPDIRTRVLQEGDDFLILASDGIWDVLSSQAAVDVAASCGNDVKQAAIRLTNTAYHAHSLDNITSMVIDLRPYR